MREHSFGQQNIPFLDQFIFWTRSRKIFPHLPSSSEIGVELGSGFHGVLLQQLVERKKIKKGVGMDLSVEKGEIPSVTLYEGDLNSARLPLSDGEVDVVLSLAVLEHLENPKHLVREAFRLLKPKHVFLLTTPSPLAKPILELMAYHLHIIDEKEIRDHKHYFSHTELRELFEEAGFREIEIRSFLFGLNTLVVGIK